MQNFTPKEIVSTLDEYIIGQDKAKKAVAIALRSRYRRMQVNKNLQKDILPKNILMVGPTGVGKTEIARRLAGLDNSPFIKVDATKYTEVGYVGKDVEQIIKDLTSNASRIVEEKLRKQFNVLAEQKAEEKILKKIVGSTASEETKKSFLTKLRQGELKDTEIEVSLKEKKASSPIVDLPNGAGHIGIANLGDIFGGGDKRKKRKLKVEDAMKCLTDEFASDMIDDSELATKVIEEVENKGIVFIDEIDKIVSSNDGAKRGDVSREGVQRDLLSLIEGTSVNTRYGVINTDHILFIASGAFHLSKPSDLLPELQGRLPVRVELDPLSKEDLKRILTEPKTNLINQYKELLKTEDIDLIFTDESIDEIASKAEEINLGIENIGARRLSTILEKILEDINFRAPDATIKEYVIDKNLIEEKVGSVIKDENLSKFVL